MVVLFKETGNSPWSLFFSFYIGNENRAVVEFAPYQRIPREHKTVDVRQGTIDEDQDYLDFLESLKAEEKSKHDLENETGDGLTQIERLENRIAMVTGKKINSNCVQWRLTLLFYSQNIGC